MYVRVHACVYIYIDRDRLNIYSCYIIDVRLTMNQSVI